MSRLKEIEASIYEGNAKKTVALTAQELQEDTLWSEILKQAMLPALDRIGQEYSDGKAFLPELIASGLAMTKAVEVIKAHQGDQEMDSEGIIILGTVVNDVHDIGKNVVKLNLEGAGYKVIDLGVNVKPEVFIQACQKHNPNIVGVSCLLSTTMINLQTTIKMIKGKGLGVKTLVGGNPITQEFADKIGADGYAPDGYLAVKKVQELIAQA